MDESRLRRIEAIDTHTGGEPTRVVISGGPDLGRGPISERRATFRANYDDFRSAVVNEPRGSDVVVGALIDEPTDPTCAAAVIFFNNVGYLGMCGHGTIGVAVALAHLGRIGPGRHRLETPVGVVSVELIGRHEVAFDNVPSYRHRANVSVDVAGIGLIKGDVAWGGNWFFITSDHGQELKIRRVDELTEFAWRIRQSLARKGVTGAQEEEIDHVELVGPPNDPMADACSFVLCPGKAYDRSPCGTGTSAKMACLVADGKLQEGQIWRQESIIGSTFEGSVRIVDDRVIPRIKGTAYVCAESTLILDPEDPFQMGIRR